MELKERMKFVGYIIYFAGERDGGAYVPAFAGGWRYTVEAMMLSRPDATLCIEPVTSIPEWVAND